MNALIKTTTRITEEQLNEVRDIFPYLTFTVRSIADRPTPTWNPYYKLIEIDWAWFRELFGKSTSEIHAYITSSEQLSAVGITKYAGLYSLDTNEKHEFWFGIPKALRPDAKANGFKSNFAYIFTHELCHGLEHFAHQKDRTHEMVTQGRLKELAAEYARTPAVPVDRKTTVSLAKQAIELILRLLRGRYQRPLPEHWTLVTQAHLNPDPKTYPATGVHIGTDFAAPLNTAILAPADGEITRSSHSSSLGNWVEFKFGNLYLIALHCANRQRPRSVLRGEPIAFVGKTGVIKGVHAHLELWAQPMDRFLLTSAAMAEAVTLDITKLIK